MSVEWRSQEVSPPWTSPLSLNQPALVTAASAPDKPQGLALAQPSAAAALSS